MDFTNKGVGVFLIAAGEEDVRGVVFGEFDDGSLAEASGAASYKNDFVRQCWDVAIGVEGHDGWIEL